MTKKANQLQEAERYLAPRQLARALSIHPETIRRLKIPSIGSGKLRRYKLSDAIATISNRGGKSTDDQIK